jgi:hypothetical protein
MATVRITNLTTSPVYLNDIYTTINGSAAVLPLLPYVDVTRSVAEISSMTGLIDAVAAGTLSATITYSADEQAALSVTASQPLASLLAPKAVPAPVAASTIVGQEITIYKALASGGATGTADDVTIYAVNTLPYKMRILSAQVRISTAGAGSSTMNVRTAAAGGGTLLSGPIASDALGIVNPTGPNATVVASPGASVGLFVRRSDRSAVGEIIIKARIES